MEQDMTAYYDLHDDVNRAGRWFLKGPYDASGRELDGRIFTEGRIVGASGSTWEGEVVPLGSPLKFRLRAPGEPLDFTFADFEVPIVTATLGTALKELGGPDIQLFPAEIEGQPGEYHVLNVVRQILCVDEARSRFQKWTERDGRPDKVGDYRGIHPLLVDPKTIDGSHIFRVRGWVVAIIASQMVKDLFEQRQYSGLKFRLASDAALSAQDVDGLSKKGPP